MKNILFFDTETTGLPYWKEPSEGENQPHLVQLAAIQADPETREVISTMDEIIQPNGWESCPEALDTHGITTDMAIDSGIPESEALQKFINLYNQCSLRVAHSTTFDNRIIRIALKRYMPDLIPDDVWKDKSNYYCTLINSRKVMGGNKGHSLPEAYKYFTGKDLVSAHTAMADAKACMEIYWGLQDLKKKEAA